VSRYLSTMATNQHHGRRVRPFGLVARGEEREESDIDLLVDVVSRGGLRARDQSIVEEALDL
jgi:predicted nucleotidyltransferase